MFKRKGRVLAGIFLLSALTFMSMAIAPDLFAQSSQNNDSASDNSGAANSPPPSDAAPSPVPNNNNNPPDPNAPAPQSAADRFQALRQKRLEDAKAYQQEQLEREKALEEQRKLEEENRLNQQRQQYASEKEAFLARFKKAAKPTPTPTPSVLDELDQLNAPDEEAPAEGAEASDETQDAQETPEEGAPQAEQTQEGGAEVQIDLNGY